MSKIKFIHTADLHLDTPFLGLSRLNSQLASKFKEATFTAFKKVVSLCISNKVDFLLICGDVFDSESKSLKAQIFFVEQLNRLTAAQIRTYLICGNHDPLISWLPNLKLPELVFRFQSKEVEKQTFYKNGIAAADVYGMSYEDKALTTNISLNYVLEKPTSPISIAMLHGNLVGNQIHGNYAPFSLKDLENQNFDYWALGHIHKAQVVKSAFPGVVYPGNPQGRDFGEKGEKGCYLVEMEPQQTPKLTFIPTHSITFEEINTDLTDATDYTEMNGRINETIDNLDLKDDNETILRINLFGTTNLHHILLGEDQLVQALKEGVTGTDSNIWIDDIILNTKPVLDLEVLAQTNDFIGELFQSFEQLEENLEQLNQEVQNIKNQISNPSLKKLLPSLSQDEIREIVTKAKYHLIQEFQIEEL